MTPYIIFRCRSLFKHNIVVSLSSEKLDIAVPLSRVESCSWEWNTSFVTILLTLIFGPVEVFIRVHTVFDLQPFPSSKSYLKNYKKWHFLWRFIICNNFKPETEIWWCNCLIWFFCFRKVEIPTVGCRLSILSDWLAVSAFLPDKLEMKVFPSHRNFNPPPHFRRE